MRRLPPVLAATFLFAACGPADHSGGPQSGSDGGGVFADGGDLPDGGGGGGHGSTPAGEACEFTSECAEGLVCYEGICVGDGTLRFSLSWETDTDIDLHVITPAGNEIYYNDEMYDGGTLDVDDCVGGDCAVPNGTHVENVFFDGSALRGRYEFWAHNYDGIVATSIKIEGFVMGVSTPFEEVVNTSGAAEGAHHSVTF